MTESETTQLQRSFRVLLVGESCIDEYRYGRCDRICPEAPVPVLLFSHSEKKNGMARNVFNNLKSFGIDVDFITNDPNLIIKRRFVDTLHNHIIMREDIEGYISPARVEVKNNYDAILISDYDKGLISGESISDLIKDFNGPVFVDSKKKDLSIFDDCILKINDKEKMSAFKFPNNYQLIVTNGKNGATFDGKVFPTPDVEVFDVTGAGDVFFSSLCYFYLNTGKLDVAIQNATTLASKSVQHAGVYVLTKDDIAEVI